MDLALIAAAVVSGWVFLCVLSTERERAAHEKMLSDITFRPTELPAQNPLDTPKN